MSEQTLSQKSVPTCPHCGSTEVVKDACARWDSEARAWVLSCTYDTTSCCACGYESDDEFPMQEPAA